jgi:hypothetical protein
MLEYSAFIIFLIFTILELYGIFYPANSQLCCNVKHTSNQNAEICVMTMKGRSVGAYI